MKTRFGKIIPFTVMILILWTTSSNQAGGQTTMGILPVNTSAVSTSVLNARQWQSVALGLHEYFVTQLADIGRVSKLSREHILLLLKEVPAPDPENLDAEAYKIISKKEKLHYLLKCSVESIQVTGKNVLAPIRVIIVDGSNGRIFWEKTLKTNRIVSDPAIDERLLLEDVFKPSVRELSKEIITLKY